MALVTFSQACIEQAHQVIFYISAKLWTTQGRRLGTGFPGMNKVAKDQVVSEQDLFGPLFSCT